MLYAEPCSRLALSPANKKICQIQRPRMGRSNTLHARRMGRKKRFTQGGTKQNTQHHEQRHRPTAYEQLEELTERAARWTDRCMVPEDWIGPRVVEWGCLITSL
eukprot:3744811-Rhodomonas_salina.2